MLPNLTDKQDKAFAAHIEDLFGQAREKYATRFTSFLDLRQLTLARQVAAASGYENFLFYGGHPEGERLMLGVFAPYEEPEAGAFPIVPVMAAFRAEDPVGHRDVLGSLTGLEICREAVGDILIGEGRAVFFLTGPASSVVLGELTKIGRWGVRLTKGLPESLPQLHKFAELGMTVSSLRLDCMTAALAGVSREKAAQLIRAQQVSVNGAVRAQTAGALCEGDVVSIRGVGKFLFSQTGRTTKKGRLQVLCKKYI